jgi:hypothetical protein
MTVFWPVPCGSWASVFSCIVMYFHVLSCRPLDSHASLWFTLHKPSALSSVLSLKIRGVTGQLLSDSPAHPSPCAHSGRKAPFPTNGPLEFCFFCIPQTTLSSPLREHSGEYRKTHMTWICFPCYTPSGQVCKEYDSEYSRDTCTPVFIAALFTRAKLWNQHRCHQSVNG